MKPDFEILDEASSSARAAWSDLFSQDRLLICTGMSTCGISAKAEEAKSAISSRLSSLGRSAEMMDVGCLGLCYCEPLVYLKRPGGPLVCYGNVSPESAESLADDFCSGTPHEGLLGAIDLPEVQIDRGEIPSIWDHPMIRPQVRIATRNCGIVDPQKIDHYLARGGYRSLAKALSMGPEAVINEVKVSGLRGRGGAGFPTAAKWEFCRKAKGSEKYLICNADEGDPGAFMDRSILEGDPHTVIEGMLIAAMAIGSTRGYIYCRAEYPLALNRLEVALDKARDENLLGEEILGSGFNFDISVKEGAGAFVCGEETALMASIEGRRGMPRTRPPFPANEGLWHKPTNINNVETFANLPSILEKGGSWYASFGVGRSRGTKTLSLAGAIKRSGLVEIPLGMTLRQIIFDIGGGIVGDQPCKGVLTGGPSGGCIPASRLEIPVDYEALSEVGSIMGSGSMIVIDDRTCIVDLARFFLTFTQRESCGKCTPCRIGTRQMLSLLEKITRGEAGALDLESLEKLAMTVKNGSLCGLGATAPNPVLTTLRHFREEYLEHTVENTAGPRCPAGACPSLISFAIDIERCKGCGLCQASCPIGAISGSKLEAHVIDGTLCIKCGSCADVCPEKFSAVVKVSPPEVISSCSSR
jgi:NADH:ubiquinone oxidoreductase subunit F (NADH-binding)/NAD-dependent dihydropyrimidine dehydrogenase PreA subunit/(2Fe-2S) ferredoxin